jgi:hypothetical protein
MTPNIMNRAVRWECGCVGFSFGWHNGVYEHVVLEICDGDNTDLSFESRPDLSTKTKQPLDEIEQDRLHRALQATFLNASLLRVLRNTLATALEPTS